MAEPTDATLGQLRGKQVIVRLRTADPDRTWDLNAELASNDHTWLQLRNPRAGQRTFPVRRDMVVDIEPAKNAAGALVA
ncbi:MAG: hypothetical protein HUU14_11200 [Dehalococcoidia bacterium]|nr:hypothetical protein [Chloroflexi bacterium CFX7]MCK6564831.1 hypothetical protein [Dehalococcoidia bacterium]NUQ56443.1 hypothetical protein [Dehalococcoidia bacterium]